MTCASVRVNSPISSCTSPELKLQSVPYVLILTGVFMHVAPRKKRVLSLFSLVMINVIAVDSLRTLPITAVLGKSLVFYYLLAAFAFFIPVTLVAAELATAYPTTGGIYIWVREAFGPRVGFLTTWLQWIYNIVWFPTILAFIVSASSYLFAPHLANNPHYLLTMSIVLFWTFTFLNTFGMRLSGFISTIGAIAGTLFPMLLIIVLSLIWMAKGHSIALPDETHWIPAFNSFSQFAILPVVLFGLLGIEMSAVHAEEVINPKRNYSRALFYSACLIFFTLSLGSLSIIAIIPPQEVSIVSGLIDAYARYARAFHLPELTTTMALLIILGALSMVSAWIIGPAKSMLAAARDGVLPRFMTKLNRFGVPFPILIIQGIVFTGLCTLFQLFETVNEAYWLLSDLAAQMALIVYILMFAAAIKLRLKNPALHRPFRIPGNNWVLFSIAGLGIACCVFAILIGFVPPAQVKIEHVFLFELYLVLGLGLFVAVPFWGFCFASRERP